MNQSDLHEFYGVPKGDWTRFFGQAEVQIALNQVLLRLDNARRQGVVYPNPDCIFRAFHRIAPDQIQVVIVGQDPYHGPGQADGLAFSVPPGTATPPSLRNIFKALQYDLGMDIPLFGDLSPWASQGVLLLNRSLSVPDGKPGGHGAWEWQDITQKTLEWLGQHGPRAFLLWGKDAQRMAPHLQNTGDHLILEAPHPSPLSAHRGFITCKHFSQVNEWLQKRHKTAIDWSL